MKGRGKGLFAAAVPGEIFLSLHPLPDSTPSGLWLSSCIHGQYPYVPPGSPNAANTSCMLPFCI